MDYLVNLSSLIFALAVALAYGVRVWPVGGLVGEIVAFFIAWLVSFNVLDYVHFRRQVKKYPQLQWKRRWRDVNHALEAEARLATLDRLRATGAITDDDFAARRNKILDEI